MKLLKTLQVSAALSLAALTAPAFAAVNADIVDGDGTFSHAQIRAGQFNDTFSFQTSSPGEAVDLSYFGSKISSLTATFNGMNIAFTPQSNGSFYGSLITPVVAGFQTLTVSGVASFDKASYSGNLATSAVPEPAAWALMIVGLGATGAVRRRRRATAAALTA